ncbi:substrate-binding domain-containing protein [Actinokineospora globicatena]|uniref:substrate-binding domain-containing protein n=1 Tax=Actinokineospora globicatena TaxID=103729 RepID=UPI002555B9C8|nr:substrate-binding domain-containing protein [Actinokineospora globicatena]
MRKPFYAVLCAVLVGAVVVTGAAPVTAQDERLSGAGTTTAFNLVEQWRRGYGSPLAFAGIGTAAGLAEFAAGHVDFALSESTFAQAGIPSGRPSTYVPIAAQSISVVYNVRLNGVPVQGLRLSNATTAKIFTGVVTRWDDPAIVADNRDIALPSLPIRPVVRAESTATTRRFTDWLNTVEPELWQAFCPGCGATNTYPSPPGMFAIAGAAGVAAYLRQMSTNGAIAYLERSYDYPAFDLHQASLQSGAGNFVAPTTDAIQTGLGLATSAADGSVDYRSILTSQNQGAYPLAQYVYLVAPTTVDTTRGALLGRFAAYALCEGQASALHVGLIPIPPARIKSSGAAVAAIPGATAVNCGPSHATQSLRTEVVAGELLMSVEPGGVALPSPVMAADGSFLTTSGRLRTITVTDTRAGDPGWSLSGQLTDFTSDAGSIARGNAAWTPILLEQAPGQVITVGPVTDLATTRVLAVATRGAGTARLTARLDLWVPTATTAGDYRALLTLTAI